MNKSKLLKKFETAEKDLGIEITSPYEVEIDDNVTVRADILVKHFGGKSGMLIVKSYDVVKPYLKQLGNLRYGFSVLEEPRNEIDEAYNHDAFVEMLSEWEWTGDEAMKPNWIRTDV